jgi:hypothetical protein
MAALAEPSQTRASPILDRGAVTIVAIVQLIHDEIGTLWHNFQK